MSSCVKSLHLDTELNTQRNATFPSNGNNGSTARPSSIRSIRTSKPKARVKSANSDTSHSQSDSHSHHSFASGDEETSSLVSIKSGMAKCCRPGTIVTQRWQMFQMIILPFIPITALIIQNSTLLSGVVGNLKEAGEINGQIGVIVQIGKLLTELQQERAEFGFCLFANNNREKRDRVFRLTSSQLNTSTADTALDELIWYNVANDVILELLAKRIRQTSTTGVWKLLIAYKNIIRSIENYSISMVYGLYYFGKGSLSQNSFNKFVRFDSLAEDYLNSTKQFSTDVESLWEETMEKTKLKVLVPRRDEIYRNSPLETKADSPLAESYYMDMTYYIQQLRLFQWKLSSLIRDQIQKEIASQRRRQIIAAVLLALVLGISPIIIYLVRNVTRTIQTYSRSLSTKTTQLKREQRKSDRLLQQMLPADVIKQLRLKKQVPAESFECVTIYFSDIVQFTKLSASSSPMEIVVMLNSLYKLFDSRIQHYDVYKVETIGDAYMVVSGLPKRNGNLHAGEICTMALDLVAGIKTYEIPHRAGSGLEIRVGINSGPCVAGVVGTTMPRYCLFGDSINTASRMESTGEAMQIHITEDTKKYLDELGTFITEPREKIEIKGKGFMTTYWLTGKEGGIPRSVEMNTPGFFKSQDTIPEFLRDIFGSSSSEDDNFAVGQNHSDQQTVHTHPSYPSNFVSGANNRFPMSSMKH